VKFYALVATMAVASFAWTDCRDASAQPIDCAQTQTGVAATICADPSLLELEGQRVALAGSKPDASTEQAWRVQLDQCAMDRECITTAYLNEMQRLRFADPTPPAGQLEAEPQQTAQIEQAPQESEAASTTEDEQIAAIVRECDIAGGTPGVLDSIEEHQCATAAVSRFNDAIVLQCTGGDPIVQPHEVDCLMREGYLDTEHAALAFDAPVDPMARAVTIGLLILGVVLIVWLLTLRTVRRILGFLVGIAFARAVYRYMNEPRHR
jgi:uncharacterized protein